MVGALADIDGTLVLRCRSNDAAAFNEIVARYKDRIHNYVSRMVGAGPDAEDLTQDVFVRAYVNIRSFESRASLNTWLFRIATNLCIDFARRAERRLRADAPAAPADGGEPLDPIADAPDTRYEPLAVLLDGERSRVLDDAIAALPDRLRSVVLLHDIEGLSYEDIARVCGCPLGTVKSRLFNARAGLRKQLAPYLSGSLV